LNSSLDLGKYSEGTGNMFSVQGPVIISETNVMVDTPHFLVEADNFSAKANINC